MTEAPERIWVQWPHVNGAGLAFTYQARPPALRQEYVRADIHTALARELAAALVREAALREALANAAGALDSAGEELSEFANILSRDPWQANHAYESAVQARSALGDRA